MQKMRYGLSSNGVTHRTSGPGAIKLRRAYFWSKSHFKKKEPLIKQYFVDIHLKEAFKKNLRCYIWLYLQLKNIEMFLVRNRNARSYMFIVCFFKIKIKEGLYRIKINNDKIVHSIAVTIRIHVLFRI